MKLHLREGHRLPVEGGHNFLGEGAQPGDRSAGGGEQHILDAAGLEPLQLRDDLLRRSEERRVVELERILVVLDVRVTLGTGAAGEVADVLQYLPAGDDRPSALLFVVHDLQPAGDADHHRVVTPPDPLAFMAEGGDALDDQIGRSDLVEQQIVALARGAADRLGTAGAEPEGRMRLLNRVGLDDDVVEMPALTMMRKPALARPRLADHVHRLVEPLGRLLGRDAEAGEFVGAIALADPEIEAAIRQQVECCRLLGDQDRVVPRQYHDRGAEPNALGAGGQIGEQAHRRRDLAKAGEMVLDQKDARKTELLGLDNVMDEVVIGGTVAGGAAAGARPAEKPESHASPLLWCRSPNIWRDPSGVDDGGRKVNHHNVMAWPIWSQGSARETPPT